MPINSKKLGRCLAMYFVIQPILFVIAIIDFFASFFMPYKYEDSELPDKNVVCSELVDRSDSKSAYRSTFTNDLLRIDDPAANLYDAFDSVHRQFVDVRTMGVREIVSIDDETQPNGKVFKKYQLGNYEFVSYERVHERIGHISNGLLRIGLRSDENVILFAETRPEWLQTAFACFRIKAPIVTLYATLGVDALAFGINQTRAKYVITSADQLTKLTKILDRIPTMTNLVVFTNRHTEQLLVDFKKATENNMSLHVYALHQVEDIGKHSETSGDYTRPRKDDLAIIMYTSGSTGNPKGVMMSHGNLLTAIRGLRSRLGTLRPGKDRIISYLPLAHVLELVCEITCLLHGIALGYSTPQTMADNSTAIKKGQKGDLRMLKPTLMCSVPIVLERLSKTVYEKLGATNWFKQALFRKAYEQKLRRFRRGCSTRLLDRVLFKSISRAVLGGKCRLMISGGAILAKEVQEFVQVCLCPVIQAYGLTETCAGGTAQLPNQTDTELVGSVVPCCEIRLVDWAEAGYRSTDTPNPRGEIYIGGENVTLGYYNMPDKTREDYSVINGVRYFATGDVGEMLPSGSIKIIDRKKDLVKLSGGEYVSLNKVESIVKLMPFVDNCCVVADSTKSYCVLLVCANLKKMRELAVQELGGADSEQLAFLRDEATSSSESLVAQLVQVISGSARLHEQLVKDVVGFCLSQGLDRFEIPTKLRLVKEVWMPDTGLVTDSLKLKRKEIEKFYKSEIELLYK